MSAGSVQKFGNGSGHFGTRSELKCFAFDLPVLKHRINGKTLEKMFKRRYGKETNICPPWSTKALLMKLSLPASLDPCEAITFSILLASAVTCQQHCLYRGLSTCTEES